MSRIYAVSESVKTAEGIVAGSTALVRANNPAQAIRHVASDRFSARVASQEELVMLVSDGVVVETAGEDLSPAAEGEQQSN